jgi:hypothetical protein
MPGQTDTATATPTLPDELRRALEKQGPGPLELVDPATRRAYVLLPREQYDALVRALPQHPETPGATMPPPTPPPAATPAQGPRKPMRQWLKDLPTPPEVAERATRRLEQFGVIFWRRYWQLEFEEKLKLQWYYGGQYVVYLPRKEGLLVLAAGQLDEAFEQQIACLDPSERREAIKERIDPWNDSGEPSDDRNATWDGSSEDSFL